MGRLGRFGVGGCSMSQRVVSAVHWGPLAYERVDIFIIISNGKPEEDTGDLRIRRWHNILVTVSIRV